MVPGTASAGDCPPAVRRSQGRHRGARTTAKKRLAEREDDGTAQRQASQASILFDELHAMRHLGDALDTVRKREYTRLRGKDRRFIKGQKYTLLSHRENLTVDGRHALKQLLAANNLYTPAAEYRSPHWRQTPAGTLRIIFNFLP